MIKLIKKLTKWNQQIILDSGLSILILLLLVNSNLGCVNQICNFPVQKSARVYDPYNSVKLTLLSVLLLLKNAA